MRVAVVGSRGLTVDNLGDYLPLGISMIISGGAKGIDSSAREYAKAHGLELVEFLPDYQKYGRGAPLRRNLEIITATDIVLIFWDERSKGSLFVLQNCKKLAVPFKVYVPDGAGSFTQKYSLGC